MPWAEVGLEGAHTEVEVARVVDKLLQDTPYQPVPITYMWEQEEYGRVQFRLQVIMAKTQRLVPFVGHTVEEAVVGVTLTRKEVKQVAAVVDLT